MELSATELRIGNLVTDKWSVGKYPFKIVSIGKTICHYFGNQEFSAKYEDLEPIPLTEEWLLKFGFEKLTDKSRGFNSNSYTYTKGISFIVHLNDKLLSVNFWQGNEKKYVHELQNLFFALTGEELTI